MGTRWSALFYADPGFDPGPLHAALQAAVGEVDDQMSTWKSDSALMALNAAPAGVWVEVPTHLMTVLRAAIGVGAASDGAFDIGVGDAVAAWGFGPQAADAVQITRLLATAPARRPAHEVLDLDLDPARPRVRKAAPLALDLSGIAKGYGVDRLAEVTVAAGINAALLSLDGEVRAIGLRPDGTPWAIAVERPDLAIRAPHAMLALEDAAVATSGDYRHWVTVGGRRLSHTMDPARGGPLSTSPASVTVVHESCMMADAWATALMVRGTVQGAALARRCRLDALFLDRAPEEFRETRVGALFDPSQAAG